MKQEIVTARNSTVTTGNTAYRLIGEIQKVVEESITKIQEPESMTYDIWNNSVPDRTVRALRLRVSGHTTNPNFTEDFVYAFGEIMYQAENIMSRAVFHHQISSHNCYRIMHRKGKIFSRWAYLNNDPTPTLQQHKTSGVWQITIYYLSGTKKRNS